MEKPKLEGGRELGGQDDAGRTGSHGQEPEGQRVGWREGKKDSRTGVQSWAEGPARPPPSAAGALSSLRLALLAVPAEQLLSQEPAWGRAGGHAASPVTDRAPPTCGQQTRVLAGPADDSEKLETLSNAF